MEEIHGTPELTVGDSVQVRPLRDERRGGRVEELVRSRE